MSDRAPKATPDAIERLRAAFRDAGYTAAGIAKALASEGEFSRDTDELPLYLRRLAGGGPLATLIELFLLHEPVDVAEAQAAGVDPADAEAMRLVSRRGSELAPLVEIVPVLEHLVACDQTREHQLPEHPDHVPGPTPPTNVLAGLTPRIQARVALDVGVGSGIQSLRLAAHCERVVGVDVNERALDFAAFNAALNGVGNLQLRRGNLYESVAGESFDLIVSNPPYIISPDTAFAFRDSGLRGHGFCEALVRGAAPVLAEGGIAVLLAEWGYGGGEDWAAPLERWVDGLGCDALLLRFVSDDPLHHAAEGNERLRSDPDAYAAALDRWTSYCRGLGYDHIDWGAVVLRRRAGANWVRAESPSGRTDWAGHHILRLLENQSELERTGDTGLLERPLALADDHRLEQTVVLRDGSGVVRGSLLRLAGGLRFQVEVDGVSAHVLSHLDGRRTLRDVLGEVGAGMPGQPTAEALAPGTVPGIRRLVELGLLVFTPHRSHSSA